MHISVYSFNTAEAIEGFSRNLQSMLILENLESFNTAEAIEGFSRMFSPTKKQFIDCFNTAEAIEGFSS